MNKRIVILTQYFPPEMGAPQSRLFEMAVGLRKKGWEVKVVTSLPNYPTGKIFKGYKRKLKLQEKINEIEILRYWMFASNSRKSLPRIISMMSFSFISGLSIFQVRKFKPDYILTESPPLLLGLTGLLLSRISKAKHVLNVSDLWPLSALELGALSKGRTYTVLEKLEKYLYKNSYGCLGQSQQIVDHIISKGVTNVQLFRNGVDIGRFQKNNEVSKNEKIKFVYVGLLGVAQGILSICKEINFKNLDTEFHIYGSGNEQKEIENFIQHNNKSIFFHGKISRENVPSVLQKHDVAFIPLIKPIFGAVPSKIYEAMAAGLPILFSGGGEGEKIIHEYVVGWTSAPSDYNALKECIVKIKGTPYAEIQEMKTRCKQVAATVFDRSIQMNKLDEFLLKPEHA